MPNNWIEPILKLLLSPNVANGKTQDSSSSSFNQVWMNEEHKFKPLKLDLNTISHDKLIKVKKFWYDVDQMLKAKNAKP